MHSGNFSQIKVSDIATRNLITIDANASLEEAGKKMYESQVSMLIVTEKDSIVGLLTSGDWFRSFYLHVGSHLPQVKFRTERAAQVDLQHQKMEIVKRRAIEFKNMKVREVMNRHFKTISQDADLIEAIHEMKSTDLRRLMVKDENGKIIGVLGRTRAINSLLEELT